jgi:double-stranded uracil-DNA glycosylase
VWNANVPSLKTPIVVDGLYFEMIIVCTVVVCCPLLYYVMSPSLRRPRTNLKCPNKFTAALGRTSSPYFSKHQKRSVAKAAVAASAVAATTLSTTATTTITSAQSFATATVTAFMTTTPKMSNNIILQKKLASGVTGTVTTTTSHANNNLSIPDTQTKQGKNNKKKNKSPRIMATLAQTTKTKHNRTSKKRQHDYAPLTTSFQPVWCGRWDDDTIKNVPVHTLILGTHPSIKSLEEQQYFGHEQNAFWWIAGDCLGFRRRTGISPLTGKPYAIAKHLKYDTNRMLSYQEQEKILVRYGFALWDIVGTCRRPGSLDQSIYDEQPNALREFAQQHQATLRRIVFANGGTGCNIFKKHFKEWLQSGELQALPGHQASEKAFGTAIIAREGTLYGTNANCERKINLVCAISVSPAAATYSYVQKRDSWEELVYQPGLADFVDPTSPTINKINNT